MKIAFLSAEAKARNVLQKYKLDSLPIRVEKICRVLDIAIRYVDFSTIETAF